MAEGLNEHRIYVGGLDPNVTLRGLENLFSAVGEVCNVSFDERGRFAFVSFRRKRDALNAIKVFDGFLFVGSPIRLEWAFGWPRETSDESENAPRLAFLRTQPEFQLLQQQPQLAQAFIRQIGKNKNHRLVMLIGQNADEFMRMVHEPQGPVVAGTSPLESSLGEVADIERATAPSTSGSPGISQLQSEPHIHPAWYSISYVPESVEPIGATNSKETEAEEKVEVTKVDQKVEETKTVDFQCKICMDEQIGVVFVPCGHLASCPRCAQRISNCPMCRKEITGMVRTYLS